MLTPDVFDPPLDNLGLLMFLKVNDKQVFGPEEVNAGGINKHWDIEIPKGGQAKIEVFYKTWFLYEKEHNYRPFRFARAANVEFVSLLTGGAPTIKATVYSRTHPSQMIETAEATKRSVDRQLEPGIPFSLPEARNCVPAQVAVSIRIEPPAHAEGAGEHPIQAGA